MPAKSGRRGRKHKGTSHAVTGVPPVEVLPKPAPYKPLDYSKFDNLVDSDEDSDHGVYTPADLGMGDIPIGGTDSDAGCGCACVHCRERAEAAEEAAVAAAAQQRSSSSKSVTAHSSSQSGFDFSKALKSESVKAKIAEGKASRANGIEDSTLRFPVTIPHDKDVAKVTGVPKSDNKSGHSKAPKSITSTAQSDLVLRPTFDTCYGFAQKSLPLRGYSDRVLCNVLEKLTLFKESKSSEDPMAALMRIFVELRIDVNPADLVAYARKCTHGRKQQQKSKQTGGLEQKSAQQREAEALALKYSHAHLPDSEGFQAMMAKQGLASTTYSFTSLSGSNQHHTQLGPQDADSEAAMDADSEASGESTPYESSSEDDDDIPPLVDIDKDICPPRYPAGSSGLKNWSPASAPAPPPKSDAKQQAAPTSSATSAQSSTAKPSAKPAAKPAATSPAKAAGKAASTASKPSLTRSSAKSPAAAKGSRPQHVTTVSDDDDDDDEMPVLVSSDGSSDDEDDNNEDPDDDDEGVPCLLTSDEEDDEEDQHSMNAFSSTFDFLAAKRAHELNIAGHPPNGINQVPSDSKAKGKQMPSAASTESKAAPSAAVADSMFKSVSRGFLAQQANNLAAKDAQAGSTSSATENAIKQGLKEASPGTPFSFNRAVSGGSKAPAAAFNSKAGAASKAEGSGPASQQPSYPFPQFETAEEYKADMGIGELNHGEHEDATGGPSWPPTGPWFDRAKETRTKHAVDTSGEPRKEWIRQHQAALEQRLRTEKLQAERADAVMKQLLEEEERDKAEAAAKAEKAKKEKQKSKKAKQKAKKKAQQDKAAGKRSQAVTSSPAQPSKARQADSSESEEEEERERFSLQNSRFASLVDDSTPLAGPGVLEGALSLGQGSQPAPPSATHGTAASSNEEEGRDNIRMQFGGGFDYLNTLGQGPASEKSQSSQDTQPSSRLPHVPRLKPGESPLPLSQVNHAAASSNQGQEARRMPLGIRPGMNVPGMYPTYQHPAPPGVRPSQTGPGPAQLGTVPSPDPAMALVVEACRGVVREMEEASGAGEKGRLQEALKGAVTWLSQNGSNPDVAPNSAQVRRALHDAKAKLKELGSRPAPSPQARQSAISAAPAASRFSQPPVSMPVGTERAVGLTAARQTLLELASEARLHPIRTGQPSPPPPRAGQPPPPPPPRVAPSIPGVQPQGPAAVRTSVPPGLRPHLQPYQPPPTGMRPGGIQGAQGPFRQPHTQQAPLQEPYRQPYPGGLEPYRPVPGGRGGGASHVGRGPTSRPPYIGPGPGQRSISGLQQTPTPQEEIYSAYRQGQAAAMAAARAAYTLLPPQPGPSHAASAYGSDYGSLDRSSMSGSEATSPVKSAEVRYEAKSQYVQPTPFGVREQPSFDEHDETDCVVCMDDVRCTIFVPCGHSLCCQSCAETVVQKYKHCPVCSTPVDGFCAT